MHLDNWQEDLNAERSVLGSIILNPDVLKSLRTLTVADFHSQVHGAIFRAIQQLDAARKPIDIVTLVDELTAMKALEAVGGITYLSDLSGYVPSTANVEAYADIVREKATRREIYAAGSRIMRVAQNMEADSESLRPDAMAELAKVSAPTGHMQSNEMLDIARRAYEQIERRFMGLDCGLTIGLAEFDNVTGGLFAGEMTVIGARPGIGKSAFALHAAMNLCLKNKRVAVFSREMTQEQLAERLISRVGRINGRKLRTGQFGEDEWETISDAVGKISLLPMLIDNTAKTPREMRDVCREAKENGGLDCIIVDYLQIVRPDTKSENRVQEVAKLSWAFKELALEFQVPVVVISQLNRSNAKGVPTLTDLRDSGAIEQDADNVVLLYHVEDESAAGLSAAEIERLYEIKNRGEQYIWLLILKQRQGQTGRVETCFDPSTMRFMSLSPAKDAGAA